MKQKRHTLKDCLKYKEMLKNGYSINFIHIRYGINGTRLECLWSNYKRLGKDALVRKSNIRADDPLKEMIVRDYLENHLSLLEASLKQDISATALGIWLRIAK